MKFPFTFENEATDNAIAKTWDILGRFNSPVCAVSGGSDSDIMLDLIHRLDTEKKVRYVWYNTGIEYEATKRHLSFLEKRYHITIQRFRPKKPVPLAVREYGVPFLSKFVSNKISQLQRIGFDFSDMDYDAMLTLCNGVCDATDWWHNRHSINQWNIRYNLGLKEYLIANPPNFRISDKCCYYAKKRVSIEYSRLNNTDLTMLGIRKSEGGNRNILTSCFSENDRHGAVYRPLFWFTDADKRYYADKFKVKHSDCYTVYGLRRTGCTGCPFNLRLFDELSLIEQHEPNLYHAAMSLFGECYTYTLGFRKWQKSRYPAVRFKFAMPQMQLGTWSL